MMTNPLLNHASRHEDVTGSGVIAPRILNLGVWWRWLVSFTPRPLYHGQRGPGTHLIGGWVGPRSGPDAVAKRKIPCAVTLLRWVLSLKWPKEKEAAPIGTHPIIFGR